jgi:hypothetical protein
LPATAVQVFGPNTVNPGFNSTGEKTLLTMNTSLPSGGNNIILVSYAGYTSLGARGVFRIYKGSTLLYETKISGEYFTETRTRPFHHLLIAVDNSPAGNDSYSFRINVTTAASSSASVHVQGMVIKADTAVWGYNTTAVSIASGGTATVTSINTSFPSGSKVAVIATVYAAAATTTAGDYLIGAGNIKLKSGATVVSSNQFNIGSFRDIYPLRASLIYLDTPTSGSQTYSVEITNGSTSAYHCFAEIVAFDVTDAAFLDTGSVAVGTSQTTVGNLSTTLSGDVAVIALAAAERTVDASGDTFAANAVVLQRNNSSTDQVSNLLTWYILSSTSQARSGILPLFRYDTNVSNPSYQVKMTASSGSPNGEAKILAFSLFAGVDIKKVFGETLQLLENIILGRGCFRLVSENVSVGEASIRQRSRFRSLAETVSVGESSTSLKSIFRRVVEQVNLVENVVRVRNLARIILEIINLSEFMVLLRRWVRTLTEFVNLNEIFSYARNRFRVSNETINLLESIRSSMSLSRILVESVNVIENIGRALGRTRVVNEFVNLLEVVGIFKEKVLRIIENINLSETFSGIKGRLWVQVEYVRISEVFSRLRNRVRVIVEQLNLSELFGVLRNRLRLVGEIINISESKFLSRVWVRIQGEVVSIGELGMKVLGKVKVIVENVRIVDAYLLKLVKTYIKRLKSVLRGMSRSNLMGSSKGGEI